MKLACVQLEHLPGEPMQDRANRVVGLVDDVGRDVDVVVLPELWPSGYFSFDRYEAEAEGLDGPTVTALSELATRRGIHLQIGSFVERHADGLSNCAVLLGPSGDVLLTYRKMHLFGYGSDEARLLVPGRDVAVVETPFGVVGMTTCYDLRFPELYRLLVDRGATMVIVPAAWPAARVHHWRLLLQARAVENQMFVMACNGAGVQQGVELAGHSAVIDPWGEVVAEADHRAQVLFAEIQPETVPRVRSEFPVLTHRRLAVMEPSLDGSP